ncbi:MAG: hypothetical protein IJ560_03960 [Alphaproteobacteria bacterium]|nr:hypothetical protein [Alphaproteobacteria bacterium]
MLHGICETKGRVTRCGGKNVTDTHETMCRVGFNAICVLCFGLCVGNFANAELPENVKFCIPKQYRVTYDCPAGGNAPTQQSTAYGNNFTTGVGCNNAPAWRVDDSDTIITSNTTIPYAYTHDIVLHADYSSLYTIAGGKLINADPYVYLESTGTQYIDTNIIPISNTGVQIDFAFTPENITRKADAAVFGVWNPNFLLAHQGAIARAPFCVAHRNSLGCDWHEKASDSERHICDVNFMNTKKFSISGIASGMLGLESIKANVSVYLFAAHSNNGYPTEYSMAKIYYANFSDDQSVIRRYVPIPRGMRIGDYVVPSNGMWDMVEQKFYPNLGTGEFIYGRE